MAGYRSRAEGQGLLCGVENIVPLCRVVEEEVPGIKRVLGLWFRKIKWSLCKLICSKKGGNHFGGYVQRSSPAD